MNYINIAIDGPAGAGKSTIAKMLAKELNFAYVDTGSMYRAITYWALKLNINLDNLDEYDFIYDINLEYKIDTVYINGIDMTNNIRSIEVTKNVSKVAAVRKVREFLVSIQRDIARNVNTVMDGRDIGTVVLPDAKYKFFLTASSEVRAKRRQKEDLERGINQDLEKLKADIERRDHYDSTREVNPLRKAKDAILIDTSDLSIKEVIKNIINTIGGNI